MSWATIREACEHFGVSRRTLEGRVARAEVPSYLEPDDAGGPGVRMVWVGPIPDPAELVAEELRQLRQELAALRAALAEGPSEARSRVEALRVAPGGDRRSQATRTRRVAPATAPSPSASSGEPWRAAWAWLVAQHPTVTAAGAAAGLSQPQASRLHRGQRKPRPATALRILAAARDAGWCGPASRAA